MAISQSRQEESNCIFQLILKKLISLKGCCNSILSYCAREYASTAKIYNLCIVKNFVTNIDSIMQEDSEMCRNNCKSCKSFYKCSNITLSWGTVF